jgi:ABC-type proline/glycine betaine transport system permease subunit
MLAILFEWIPLGFVVAYVASKKGRSGVGLFFLSLLFVLSFGYWSNSAASIGLAFAAWLFS